jgi:hypothetical protein
MKWIFQVLVADIKLRRVIANNMPGHGAGAYPGLQRAPGLPSSSDQPKAMP